jgi:hypothetical protein
VSSLSGGKQFLKWRLEYNKLFTLNFSQELNFIKDSFLTNHILFSFTITDKISSLAPVVGQ